MRKLAVPMLVALLAGCSSQPTTQEATAPAGKAAAAADTTPIPSAAEGAETADSAGAAEPQSKKEKVPAGYRRVTRNGKELYCRSEVLIGSRFPKEMCFTREQLAEIATRTESAMDDMEIHRRVCVGDHCTSP